MYIKGFKIMIKQISMLTIFKKYEHLLKEGVPT